MLDLMVRFLARGSRRLPSVRGRGSVAQCLYRTISGHVSGEWNIPMKRGHVMRVPCSAAQTWMPAFTGRYDDEELDCILPLIRPDSFALDVGACFGFYTVPLGVAARRVHARVLAFEPVSSNRNYLLHNLAANALGNVVDVMPLALGNSSGRAIVRLEPHGVGNAAVVAVDLLNEAGFTCQEVLVERLDDLQLPDGCTGRPCSLVKMDIEGFELEALRGAERFVLTHRPVILGEFNPWFLDRYRVDPQAPRIWAESHGYVCCELVYSRRGPLSDRRRIVLRAAADASARTGTPLLLLPAERLNEAEAKISLCGQAYPH